jgi:trans-2,3-dihydro-3-hydroxyanthranilate isomerase
VNFYLADVFAERPHAGNQLAVFAGARGLPAGAMQTLAREMNFSESTFIVSDGERDGGWDVRIFTPACEVPFAGHPTLGTAQVIRDAILPAPRDEIRLNLGVGQIPVRYEAEPGGPTRGFMRQPPPVFGAAVPHETVAALLGVERRALDERFPAQQVSTGLPFLIAPFRELADVQRARLDRTRYRALVREHDLPAIYFFCPQTLAPENRIHARMFADDFGVPEDPATGSACGCLAAYLVEHRYLGSERVAARVEQGHEIGRPSLLLLRARREASAIEVEVGGRVFLVARGEWLGALDAAG